MSTRTDTLSPYPTLFLSPGAVHRRPGVLRALHSPLQRPRPGAPDLVGCRLGVRGGRRGDAGRRRGGSRRHRDFQVPPAGDARGKPGVLRPAALPAVPAAAPARRPQRGFAPLRIAQPGAAAAASLAHRPKDDDRAGLTGTWSGGSIFRADRKGGTMSTARSEEHTSELQYLMRNAYAVFCLKTKKRRKE